MPLQMYGLIWLTDLRTKLSKLDLFTMLASALCHDLDHPGYNNVYQVTRPTGGARAIGPLPRRSPEPLLSLDSFADQRQDRPGSSLQRHFPSGEPPLRRGFRDLVEGKSPRWMKKFTSL